MDWAGTRSIEWSEETIRAQDCVVISTHPRRLILPKPPSRPTDHRHPQRDGRVATPEVFVVKLLI